MRLYVLLHVIPTFIGSESPRTYERTRVMQDITLNYYAQIC
jgi:hypothetical protein